MTKLKKNHGSFLEKATQTAVDVSLAQVSIENFSLKSQQLDDDVFQWDTRQNEKLLKIIQKNYIETKVESLTTLSNPFKR